MTKQGRLILLIALLAASGSAATAFGAGPVRILYMGSFGRGKPFLLMRSDPLFSIVFVQASLRAGDFPLFDVPTSDVAEVVSRLIRPYMPRSYPDLTSRFDVLAFNNANVIAISDHAGMLARGVREAGLGLFMAGGWESFGGASGFPAWGETPIGEILPTADVPGVYEMVGLLVVARTGHELMRSLPWDSPQALWSERTRDVYHNVVTVKSGANELAYVQTSTGRDPAMVTWELEGGARAFSFTAETDNPERWEYFYDMGANLMIYISGLPVPQDLSLVHGVRNAIQEVATRRSLLVSLLDFVESFGASTQGIMEQIDEVEGVVSEGRALYLDLRLEGALDKYGEANGMYKEVESDAMKVKDKTLFWVYVINWLAVSATALICGAAIWTLMVRRRLYRVVETTKFHEDHGHL